MNKYELKEFEGPVFEGPVTVSVEVMTAIQKRIALANSMKTAIRRTLIEWDEVAGAISRDNTALHKRMKELRKAMEAYTNM